MQELILFIKPQFRDNVSQDYVKVDMFSDENVTLTQVIQDVRDIDKVFTDYSQTFSLPASKINNKLFQHWYNPDIDGFDSNIQSEAIIELNYQHFKSGKVQLQEVKMKNNKPSVYKITFFGKTVSFKNLIGNDQLKDLSWLDNFTYESNPTNIVSGLNTGLDFTVDSTTYTEAIIYPLISQKQRYIYDSTGTATTITSGTTTNSASDKLHDDNKNFTNVVLVNDIVKNTTDNTIAIVTAIDDNTTLTLSVDIMSNGENYTIHRTNNGNIALTSATLDPNYNKRGVFPEDIKPAIKLSLIIKAIEEQYGIEFKTGGFFDSSVFTNLYLWLSRTKDKLVTGGVKDINNTTNPKVVFNCLSSTTICDYFAYGNVNSFISLNTANGVIDWRRANTTQEDLTVDVTITPASGYASTVYDVELIRGSSTAAALIQQTGTKVLNKVYGTGGEFVQNNTDVQLFVRVTSEDAFAFQCDVQLTYTAPDWITGTQVANFQSQSSSITLVGNVIPTIQIPEMNVLDFLNGLFRQFNLTTFLDRDDKIVVKTLDEFYSDSTTTHDISQYIKTDDNTVSEALPFSMIDLKYTDADSILANAYYRTNNKLYGSIEYDANSSQRNDYTIELPFNHLLYERLNDYNGTQTVFQYGLMVNENEEATIGKPLIFYGINLSAGANIGFSYIGEERPTDGTLPATGSQVPIGNFWMPHNASELGTASTAPTYNLNFGSEINSYTLTDYGGNNNSLFQLYYQNYILRVFNTKTRIFKYKAILPLKFLLTYSLADKIFVNGRAFTINKITTKLQTGESSLELLNEPT
jgi:hypothetical protein